VKEIVMAVLSSRDGVSSSSFLEGEYEWINSSAISLDLRDTVSQWLDGLIDDITPPANRPSLKSSDNYL
jgi:hypothetical protein